jgi:hypothetical protein
MRIAIFSLCLFLCSTVFGQKVIELKNKETGKTRILKSGSKLQFKTIHDSTYLKAKIVQIKDSVIVFYIPEFEDGLPLMDVKISDLKEIKKPTRFHAITRGAGAVLLPVGTFLLLNGVLTLTRGDSGTRSQSVSSTFIGLGITALGAAPFIFKPLEYNLSKEWAISVKVVTK